MHTEAAEKAIPAEVSGAAREAAVGSMLEKKISGAKAHLRVVTNTMYAFVKWDDDYVKSKEEEEAWQAVSVDEQTCAVANSIAAHCLSLV